MKKNNLKKSIKIISLFFFFSFLGTLIEALFYIFDGISPTFYDKTIFFFFGIKIPFLLFYGFMGLLLVSIEKILCKIKVNFILRGILYGLIIVASEFFVGLISLRLFNFRPWDYSGHLLNFMGVVSVQMFLIWCIIGIMFTLIYSLIKRNFFK